MMRIAFDPWVGSLYRSGPVHLLLVGDSHYGEPDEDSTKATQTVVDRWKTGDWKIRYLTAAARVLTGKSRKDVNRHSDLESISFYNFVQTIMPWNNVRPTADQYLASAPAFLEVVDCLQPTHILVTGKAVWEHLPSSDKIEEAVFADKKMPLRFYATKHGSAKTTCIPHLSRYFSPPQWCASVAAFLSA